MTSRKTAWDPAVATSLHERYGTLIASSHSLEARAIAGVGMVDVGRVRAWRPGSLAGVNPGRVATPATRLSRGATRPGAARCVRSAGGIRRPVHGDGPP